MCPHRQTSLQPPLPQHRHRKHQTRSLPPRRRHQLPLHQTRLPTATPNVPPTPKPTPTPRVQAPPVPSLKVPSMSEGTGTRPPDRDLEELAIRLRGVAPSDLSPAEAAPLTRGTQETFWITNLDDGSAHSITATLHVVSDNAYWFVREGRGIRQSGPGGSSPHLRGPRQAGSGRNVSETSETPASMAIRAYSSFMPG